METIIRQVRQCLQDSIDKKVLKTSGHFFKKGESVPVYGVGMYHVGKIAKESFKEIKELPKADVFDFVISHRATMPRKALRYAIEKMPQELRKEPMKMMPH